MNFWENDYRVEEDGAVYNIKSGRKLKALLNKKGYYQISLFIEGKSKMMFVHRLVALTYIPNEDNLRDVDHIDRNKLNNHFINLRWLSHVENMQNTDLGKSGERNIHIRKNNRYEIHFQRNRLNYWKYPPKTSTLEEVVKQRDLMLSMF
tara:strand:+ start:96 stop:542 length:447 start_codon:yes stop_codon:yes gene_type:complete